MNTSHYDALVIGGGPAGSTAALVMARAGLRVRVLERSKFPTEPASSVEPAGEPVASAG